MPFVHRRPILACPSLGLGRRARRVQGNRHGQDVRARARGPESGEGSEGGRDGRQGEDRAAADEEIEVERLLFLLLPPDGSRRDLSNNFSFWGGPIVSTPQTTRQVPRLHQPPQMPQLLCLSAAASTTEQRVDRPARTPFSFDRGLKKKNIHTSTPHSPLFAGSGPHTPARCTRT